MGPLGIARQHEPQLDISIVQGTFIVFKLWACVLINTGASHSFIASYFALALGLEVKVLDPVLLLDIPLGGRLTWRRVCRHARLRLVINGLCLTLSC